MEFSVIEDYQHIFKFCIKLHFILNTPVFHFTNLQIYVSIDFLPIADESLKSVYEIWCGKRLQIYPQSYM